MWICLSPNSSDSILPNQLPADAECEAIYKQVEESRIVALSETGRSSAHAWLLEGEEDSNRKLVKYELMPYADLYKALKEFARSPEFVEVATISSVNDELRIGQGQTFVRVSEIANVYDIAYQGPNKLFGWLLESHGVVLGVATNGSQIQDVSQRVGIVR